jgi:Conserved mid region of cactin
MSAVQEELKRLEQRRAEREREEELREEEAARMTRLQESAQMAEWIAKEDDFHLEQSRRRAEIRIRENRAKPIDLLGMNLKWSVPQVPGQDDEEDEGVGLDIDLEEPYLIFEVLIFFSFPIGWVLLRAALAESRSRRSRGTQRGHPNVPQARKERGKS